MDVPILILEIGNWRVRCGQERDFKSPVVLAKQQHTGVILAAEKILRGVTVADGILVAEKNIEAGVYTSDCLPLGLLGKEKAIIAHVSRKSLVAGILGAIEDYLNIYDLEGVYMGPHICKDHFIFESMGAELKSLHKMFPEAFQYNNVIWKVDLESIVKIWLKRWSYSGKIWPDGRCTFACKELPSYRRGDMGTLEQKTRLLTTVRRVK